MKCKNCNWPNRPNEKVCVKCGAPLTEDAPGPKAPEPPIPMGGSQGPMGPQGPMGGPMGDPQGPMGPQPGNMPHAPKGGVGTMPLTGATPVPPAAPVPGAGPMPGGMPGGAPRGPLGPMGQPQGPQGPMGQPGGAPYRPSNMCPRCSYPLRPGMTECPNCHLALTPVQPAQPQQPRPAQPQPVQPQQPRPAQPQPVQPQQPRPAQPQPVQPAQPRPAQPQQPAQPRPQGPLANSGHQPTVVGLPGATPAANPAAPKAAHRATVNIYTAPVVEDTPKFSISPVARLNETNVPKALDFEGTEAILNRANTDPENLSITSRQQAAISRRGNKWVITDMSDQKTTFVRPSREGVELHDGDVILLGNRMFIFHEK